MFSSLVKRFTSKPSRYYSMSIAATWAGVGSLMVGIEMLQKYGIAPFLIWALGNTLACIFFGLFAPMIPKLREVFRSKPMHVLVGIICIFQVWVNLNGIQSIYEETPLTGTFGMILAYALAAFFIVLLLKYGMIRTVLSDHVGWIGVYVIATLLTIFAVIHSQGDMNALAWGADKIGVGIEKGVLLLPGPFLYPYFFSILDYNEKNEDGTRKVDIRRAFINGGLLFGVFLIFTFLLAWTNFSPVLSTIKAVLITLVSTVASFMYSIYVIFGRKWGLILNVATTVAWQFLIPLGVMGAWTLMASIRIYVVIGAILFAIVWSLVQKRKAVRV